jgi:hypothetical protein
VKDTPSTTAIGPSAPLRLVNRPRVFGHGANGRHKALECAERITFTVYGGEHNAREVLAAVADATQESERFQVICLADGKPDIGIVGPSENNLGTTAYISIYRHGLGSNEVDVMRFIARAARNSKKKLLEQALATDLFKGRTRRAMFDISKANTFETFVAEPAPATAADVLQVPNPPTVPTDGNDPDELIEQLRAIYTRLGEVRDRSAAVGTAS